MPNGILCLETIWFDEQENPSTRHLLKLLRSISGMPFVYRDVSTYEEFDFYLGRWLGRHTYKKDYVLGDYGILYLGFHGGSGEISLRRDLSHGKYDEGVDLERLAKCLLDDEQYSCQGSVIHFASCSLLRAKRRVSEFKDKVGAACVSGYTKQVDATLSWAFELIYLNELSRKKSYNPSTLQTLKRKVEEKPEFSHLAKSLGFHMIV